MIDPASFYFGAAFGAAALVSIRFTSSRWNAKAGDDKPSAPQSHDVWYFWTPEESARVRDHLFAWLSQPSEVRGVPLRGSVQVSVNMLNPISDADLRAPEARWWKVGIEYRDEADLRVLLAKTRSLAWGDASFPFTLDGEKLNGGDAGGAS